MWYLGSSKTKLRCMIAVTIQVSWLASEGFIAIARYKIQRYRVFDHCGCFSIPADCWKHAERQNICSLGFKQAIFYQETTFLLMCLGYAFAYRIMAGCRNARLTEFPTGNDWEPSAGREIWTLLTFRNQGNYRKHGIVER